METRRVLYSKKPKMSHEDRQEKMETRRVLGRPSTPVAPSLSREEKIKQDLIKSNNWAKIPKSQHSPIIIINDDDLTKLLKLCGWAEDNIKTAVRGATFDYQTYYKVWKTPKRVNLMKCTIKSEFEEGMDKHEKKLEEGLRDLWDKDPELRNQWKAVLG
jgi:hypothetical protein